MSSMFQRMLDPALIVDMRSGKIVDKNYEATIQFKNKTFLSDIINDDIEKFDLKDGDIVQRRVIIDYNNKDFIAKASFFVCDNTLEVILKLENEAEYVQELKRFAYYDSLTGIKNKRSLDQKLKQVHEKAEILGKKYSVLFLDIDNFKHFNDTNGHQAGDKCLRQVAQIIEKTTRKNDETFSCYRYGGEEFVIICEDSGAKEAKTIGERIRTSIHLADFDHEENQPGGNLTVSLGVSCYESGRTIDQIKERADKGLYEAKKAGRNKVIIYYEKDEVAA